MNSHSPVTAEQKDGLHSLHLKLVAKLTLISSLSATGILLILLYVVTKQGQTEYLQIIQAHTMTRMQLGPSMMIAALVLLTIVGISVWLVSLYSSFRIAGPLYRLTMNIKSAMRFDYQHAVRHEDALQGVAQELRSSIDDLEQHYQQLHQHIDAALTHLDDSNVDAVNAAITRLVAIESAVQLDD